MKKTTTKNNNNNKKMLEHSDYLITKFTKRNRLNKSWLNL